MEWTFRGDKPIYAQLVEYMQLGVLGGAYPPGSAVPSVRTLAAMAEVNPNTMQRALAELEAQGLIDTHRTVGRTVTEDKEKIEKTRAKFAQNYIGDFLSKMKALGIDKESAEKMLKEGL